MATQGGISIPPFSCCIGQPSGTWPMGNEPLICFTTLLLAVERILTVMFVGLAKFCMGKKVEKTDTNW